MRSNKSMMWRTGTILVPVLTLVVGSSPALWAGESPSEVACVGDCDGDGQVTVDELVVGVNIALGTSDLSECPAFDPSGDGQITVDELVQGTDHALNGCSVPSPTATVPEPTATDAIPTETSTVEPTATLPEPTATLSVPTDTSTPEPPTPTPTEPLLGSGNECAGDTCVHDHTQVVAIGHSNKDSLGTILYRVTVQDRNDQELSIGTNWGDGVNGFFYRVTVDGETKTYVPFNGVGVGSDNRPTLRRFSFIVPANADTMSMTIEACATNYQGNDTTTPCMQMLWSDEHDPLPLPDTAGPPWGNASLEFVSTDAVVVVNNGVYGGHVSFRVVDLSMHDIDLTAQENAEWFAKHLVFLDDDLNVHTNDLFSETLAALPIDQAAFATAPGGTSFRPKYGAKDPVDNAPANPSYFLYVRTSSTQQFGVAAKFLFDTESSTGSLGGQAAFGDIPALTGSAGGSTSCGGETPCKTITPEDPTTAISVIPDAEAGEKETRLICFTEGSTCYVGVTGTCVAATNPLAINTASAINLPDYVIDRSIPDGTWTREFGPALYYVVSTGFGNCDQASLPFCEQQTQYRGYVPHYFDLMGQTGPLNGGSTTAPLVGALSVADQYPLSGFSNTTANRLVWFDNCGGGHFHVECAQGAQACKRNPLPSPPNNATAINYSVTNSLLKPVVFAKECCASFYQQNSQSGALEPPQQIDNGYGVFVAASRSAEPGPGFTYETLFKDEAIIVYDAATGERLHKMRLQPSGVNVYGCADSTCLGAPQGDGCPSVSFTAGSGSNPNAVTLAAAGVGSNVCAPIGDCPFGTSTGFDGQLTTCTATSSDFILGVGDWGQEVSGRTSFDTVQLRAWGSRGNNGGKDSGCSGGSAGAAGYASTSRTFSTLADHLYAYAGGVGVSAILSADPLSSLSDPSTADPAGFAYLIAGGGGTGGDGNENDSDCTGGNGGAAGVAFAKNSNPISNQFGCGNGAVGDRNGATGGEGCSNGKGGDKGGATGIGGYSGGTKWNTGTLIPPNSWSAGNGAGASNGAGPGGGGYGGGGGGGSATVGGGAGGGSWAAPITAFDPFYPTETSSPNGNNGAVQLAYLSGYRPALYRVNCGGSQLTPTDGGTPWVADTPFLTAGGENTDTSTHAIDLKHHALASAVCPAPNSGCLGGAPEALFQSERVDPSGGSEMQYAFPVASGDVLEIRLLLAETDPSITKPGERVFSVEVEGSVPPSFANIDVFGSQYVGMMVVALHTMTDNTLNLEFVHKTGNPAIKGIEIRTVSAKVAGRGLWTSTAHPFPTACLSAPEDAGVILSNQNHALVWQSNGELVLVDPQGRAIWRSGTSGSGRSACFQSDGNLVVYTGSGQVAFGAATADGGHSGKGGTRLVLNDNCNLTITNVDNTVLFQTNTTCSSTPLPTYTPTFTVTRTPTQTPVPSATLTVTRTPTASYTASATRTVTSTRTVTHTYTATPTHTISPTQSATPSVTPTATPEPSSTSTESPTVTNTPAPTDTPTSSPTSTATPRTVEVLTNALTSTNHPEPAACLQLPGDDGIVLDNGVAQLVWKTDGNLVLQQGATVLFQTNTSDDELGGNGGRQLCFPNSLIIYDESAAELFSTETGDGHLMRLDANCNLVIASLSGTVLFETSTQCQ